MGQEIYINAAHCVYNGNCYFCDHQQYQHFRAARFLDFVLLWASYKWVYCNQEGFPAFPFHIALLLYHDSFFGFLRSGSTIRHRILGARSHFNSSANSLPCMGFWLPNRNAIHVPPEHPPKVLQSVRCACQDPKLHEHFKKYPLCLGQELKAPFVNDASCHFNSLACAGSG